MNTVQSKATYYINHKNTVLIWVSVFLLLCLCTAFSAYSTKGEPREALVSMTMLSSGNWILPIDASGDMSFKPPMFHWLAALFSLPVGHVTEFTSRLPSVLAFTVLLYLTARFCSRRETSRHGLLCVGFLFTCFEMMRAGTIARVDMLLTAFMVGAMLALFYSTTRRRPAIHIIVAVLCISGGVLTKGPVAAILPLGAYWIWRLTEHDNFFKVTGMTIFLLVVSLILPLWWYYAAYQQGGNRFLTLAMEENFGRFTGKMTYGSHEHGLLYNFYSVLIGLLPWSAAIIVSFFIKPVRQAFGKLRHFKRLWGNMTPEARFGTIAALTVFVFYCIPKSKRSVYLLPMYPFMAYGLGWYAMWLIKHTRLQTTTLYYSLATVVMLYVAGIGVALPIVAKNNSDNVIAFEIKEVIPAKGPIYTFIPERFGRFYILEYYLDGRFVALVPSSQVQAPDQQDIKVSVPAEQSFYLLTGEKLLVDNSRIWHAWLNENNLQATEVYKSGSRCHDIKDAPVLFKVEKR
ncbi:MAG: glycosyltransferase family 39 protein [Muribaculaceae bacterium]|nr:glycosyltransferase family 39 protein [Muribaculaceae bacterium]